MPSKISDNEVISELDFRITPGLEVISELDFRITPGLEVISELDFRITPGLEVISELDFRYNALDEFNSYKPLPRNFTFVFSTDPRNYNLFWSPSL